MPSGDGHPLAVSSPRSILARAPRACPVDCHDPDIPFSSNIDRLQRFAALWQPRLALSTRGHTNASRAGRRNNLQSMGEASVPDSRPANPQEQVTRDISSGEVLDLRREDPKSEGSGQRTQDAQAVPPSFQIFHTDIRIHFVSHIDECVRTSRS
jgi:hypothetical protein